MAESKDKNKKSLEEQLVEQLKQQRENEKKAPGSPLPDMPEKPIRKLELKFNFNLRKLLIWFIILLLFVPALIQILGGFSGPEKISLTQAVTDVREDKVEKIVVNGSDLKIHYKDSDEVKVAFKEENSSLVEVMEAADVDVADVPIEVQSNQTGQLFWNILGTVGPLLLMGLFFFFILRQARGTQNGIMGFGKSKAKLFSKGKQDVKFKDVGGVKEAKQELEEVVDFLKNPKKYNKLGARTPKGVLLVGPSGTGKTLLARAVAGEADVPFFSMAGSEFMEMLVGVGASRVRDLFDTAKKASPSIIFIDEIDAIGRSRGMGSAGGHDEREQTLNQILVEMDGFTQSDNVIVLAATNRGDLLDKALTRPGRFDRRVLVTLPDIEERKKILKIHAQNKPFEADVNWDRAARRTVGYSGADLENMLNEAAILAARENRKKINWTDMEEAATKVKLGPEKKRLQNEYERKMTAYHEAGHALVAHFCEFADPVHRVSIVSRGMALGYTLTPPEQDKYQQTKSELKQDIAVLMGGRAAEEQIFNELTGGASSDIDKATRVARSMVIDYGMSKLGPIHLGPQYDTTSWGSKVFEPSKISEELQAKVDIEIARLIDEGKTLAETILKKYHKEMDAVADELLENETIDGEEFEKIVGKPKARPKFAENNKKTKKSN